jgi:hypothetical protein
MFGRSMFVLCDPEFFHPVKSCWAFRYLWPTFSAHIPLKPAALAWADLSRKPEWLILFLAA